MCKMGPVEKWLIIRASIQEIQEETTTKEVTKQKPTKKSVKRKKRRTK